MRSIARQVCEQLVNGKLYIFPLNSRGNVSGRVKQPNSRLKPWTFTTQWASTYSSLLFPPLLLQHKWLVSTRYLTRSPTACTAATTPGLQGPLELQAGRDPAESQALLAGMVSLEILAYLVSREREVCLEMEFNTVIIRRSQQDKPGGD